MKISAQTVKVFRKQLYKKCNISSQAELFRTFHACPNTTDTNSKRGKLEVWAARIVILNVDSKMLTLSFTR
ncbi:hypothetical protein HED50_21360 [Ochrobactrum oryzae]|nr:hypothetical protein [Brucella oryzae]